MSDDKATAVGHIPSGLFIVCAHNSDTKKSDGFLGSWIQQVSFDPLLISLCIKPGRPAYDAIKAEQTFSINVVGEEDTTFLKHFWSGYDPEKDVFAEVPHEIKDGAVVMTGAKSTIICKLRESHNPGDHEIVIAEVLDSVVSSEDSKPKVHIRKSGLDY